MDVRAALEGHLDEVFFPGRRDVGRQGELPERLNRPGRFGDADLVAEVGEGGDVILLGRAHELAGGPILDLRQDDVGRQDLVGLEAMFEGFQESFVELGKFSSDLQPLAPVLGGLEEAVGLDDRQQLRLEHGPLLLLVSRLGHVIAVRRLMAQLHRLAKRHVKVDLPLLDKTIRDAWLLTELTNVSGGIRTRGRRSHHNVGLRAVGKWRATSTASAEGVVGFPRRRVARSGLLVNVP